MPHLPLPHCFAPLAQLLLASPSIPHLQFQGTRNWGLLIRRASAPTSALGLTSVCFPCVQFQGTRDWDTLLSRAFAAMDPNGDGVISAEELEQLLCGEDGCEVGTCGHQCMGAACGGGKCVSAAGQPPAEELAHAGAVWGGRL